MSNATALRGVSRLRTMVGIKADESGSLPSELELLRTGMWDAPYHGMFMVTPEDLQQYVQNFASDVRPSSSTEGLPIDLDHDGGAAAGWIHNLEVRPNDEGGFSLWGTQMEWTPMGSDALTGGVYKFFSPEFAPCGYIDPEGQDEPMDNVLIGGGLVNRPLFKDLKPVMASEAGSSSTSGLTASSGNNKIYISTKERSVDLETLRTKKAADLSDEEKRFLADHKAELTADERAEFGFEDQNDAGDADSSNDDKGNDDDSTGDGADDQSQNNNNDGGTQVTAGEGKTVTISASQLKELQENAARGVLAHDKLMAKEATDKINGIAFSAKDGFKFAPKQRDNVTSFYLSCSDKQKTAFEKLVSEMPALVKASSFKEEGDGGQEGDVSAYAEMVKLANDAITNAAKERKTLSFKDAINKVATENPELAKAYDEEIKTASKR